MERLETGLMTSEACRRAAELRSEASRHRPLWQAARAGRLQMPRQHEGTQCPFRDLPRECRVVRTSAIGESGRVATTASAAGTRIDCDHCGHHVASHFLRADELRRLTGYVRLDGRDCCPRCALHVL
jgi:hypothetical protein